MDFNNNFVMSNRPKSLSSLSSSSRSHIPHANHVGYMGMSTNEYEQSNSEHVCAVSGESTVKNETVAALERKIEMLNNLLQEQQNILIDMKKDLKKSVPNAPVEEMRDVGKNPQADLIFTEQAPSTSRDIVPAASTPREKDPAKSFLDAIERKHATSFERGIKNALITFLQSDALKDHVVLATEDCVKDVIRSSFSENFSTFYLPMLDNSHRRLLENVTKVLEDTFKDLERNADTFSKSASFATKSLRKVLEKNEILLAEMDHNKDLLQNLRKSLQEILQKELKEMRENLLNVLSTKDNKYHSGEGVPPPSSTSIHSPASPPQPANPESSILEQLMKSAQISKEIKEGDVNKSFTKALSSSDLSLVMAACRAADPAKLFSPRCILTQAVLLSLIQQLATDMVHDTQLKCRYLENAIMHLNILDPVTRNHLPMIVTEIDMHLTKFLKAYPNHVASRKVILINKAAQYLLQKLYLTII